MAAVSYTETLPRADVRDVAEAAWSACFNADVLDWLVLPDGCVDIVLTSGRAPSVAGPATRPAVLAFEAGTATVGVRLAPGAAPALLGVAAAELRDALVPLDSLGRRWAGRLGAASDALERGSVAEAAALLAGGLAAVERRSRPDALVAHATRLLRAAPGRPAATLAASLAISPRQLRRRFADHVGYSPKRFARNMRLQAFLRLHALHPDAPTALLAAEAGYADQPHLVHECRAIAGRSPTGLLAQRGAIETTVLLKTGAAGRARL